MDRHNVRVRFAPSPTGYLHVGSARTALFNWLFAKSKNGTLILRIEDTDKKRSGEVYLKEILASLKWLGLEWDEKPYFQSKRTPLYRKYAKALLDADKAYKVEGGAVIFRMPKETVTIDDLVHGPMEFDNALQDDLVIIKTDGTPTYNFACVVDDVEMAITHVIRGDDHISNTPKQFALYRALEVEIPRFAHIPLILGMDRSRLSKRHGATSIEEYRKEGYIPDGLINFLALMGWSPGGNREIIPREELARIFSLNRVGKTSAVFDLDKMNWVNSQHIKMTHTEKLLELLKPYLKKAKFLKKSVKKNALKETIRLYKGRMKRLSDFTGLTEYLFQTKVKYDKEVVKKFLKRKELKVIFSLLIKDLEKVKPYTVTEIEKCCRDLIQRLGIGGGDLIHPVRVAITGRTVTPGLFDVMYLLGKNTTIRRLKLALKKYIR